MRLFLQHRQMSSLSGDFYLEENICRYINIGWFRSVADQKWNEILTDRTYIFGLTFWGFKLSISRTKHVWNDDKEPKEQWIK